MRNRRKWLQSTSRIKRSWIALSKAQDPRSVAVSPAHFKGADQRGGIPLSIPREQPSCLVKRRSVELSRLQKGSYEECLVTERWFRKACAALWFQQPAT